MKIPKVKSISDFPSVKAAIESSEQALYIPPGNWGCAETCVVRNKPLTLVGAGDQSKIIFNGYQKDFLDFHGGSVHRDAPTLRLEKLRVQTIVPAGRAITARYDGVSQPVAMRSVNMDAVSIVGYNTCGITPETQNFMTGIELINCNNSRLTGVMMDACLAPGSIGIRVDSTEDTHATETRINECTVDKFDTGIVFSGFQEGLYLNNSTIISTNTGLVCPTGFAGRPGLWVRGNHFNCRISGIYVQEMAQIFIESNLFYMMFGNGVSPYCAINTGADAPAYSKDGYIRNNTIFKIDNLAPDSYGIVVPGGNTEENFLIDGNKIIGFRHGIILQPGSNKVRVTNTNEFRGVQYKVIDQSPGNNIVEVPA